jgi:hypothetical protein
VPGHAPSLKASGVDPLELCLAPAAVDLDAAVRDAAAAAEPVARSRRVRIRLAVAPGTIVPADPSVLQMALREIILARSMQRLAARC